MVYLFGGFNFSVGLKVPVYQHIIESGDHEGGQLTYPGIINLGVQRTFDVAAQR